MIFAHQVTPSSPAGHPTGGRLVSTEGKTLPLRHAHLEARAEGGLARSVLTQRFVNPYAEPLHVTYLLPLPSDGAVSGFSFTLGETKIVGEVDTKHRARERFETALSQGRTAALLEQDRSSLFTQEVGNIPPGAEVVAEIIVDQKLRWLEEGAWEFRFPTVVGPRYQGAPGRVPDAAKLEVPVSEKGVSARSSLAFLIADACRGNIESPSHRVRSEQDGTDTSIRFEESRLDRDVVVRWPVATPDVGASISFARPTDSRHEGKAYGLLTLVPPKKSKTSISRDLTLLLDTSGSMGGRPLDQLKRVALALIETLGADDRLEMIEFSSRPSRFKPEPIVATPDGKRAAAKWIKSLRAGGGTEMHTAVLEALRSLRPDAQRQVVLMTDGFIGFEREITDTLMTKLPPNVRLHTVGVGSAPNRSLTEPAARAGRGVELIVGLDEDPDRAAHRLTVRTSQPLVTDVRIEGSALLEVAPRQMPDLFAGCPALISLALRPEGGELFVEGNAADGSFSHRIVVPAQTLGAGNHAVCTRFGREKVEDLEMMLSAGQSGIDAQIETTGLTFQIATRLTSWIATTEHATVDPSSQKRREDQPHELPHGTSIEGLGLRTSSLGVDGFADELMSLEEAPLMQSADMPSFGAGGMPPTGAPPSPSSKSKPRRRARAEQKKSRRGILPRIFGGRSEDAPADEEEVVDESPRMPEPASAPAPEEAPLVKGAFTGEEQVLDDEEIAEGRARADESARVRTGRAVVLEVSDEGIRCHVDIGKIRGADTIRIVRNGTVVWEGSLSSLRVDGTEVASATQWLECVIQLDGHFAVNVGDIVEAFSA